MDIRCGGGPGHEQAEEEWEWEREPLKKKGGSSYPPSKTTPRIYDDSPLLIMEIIALPGLGLRNISAGGVSGRDALSKRNGMKMNEISRLSAGGKCGAFRIYIHTCLWLIGITILAASKASVVRLRLTAPKKRLQDIDGYPRKQPEASKFGIRLRPYMSIKPRTMNGPSFRRAQNPRPKGQGSRARQGQRPSIKLSKTHSTPRARPHHRQPMRSDFGDDGNEENLRKPLKHSNDESDDGSSAGKGKRKQRDQMRRRRRSGENTDRYTNRQEAQTDQYSNRQEAQTDQDSNQQEARPIDDSTPAIYDIASARIPDHLLNDAAFTAPPQYSFRPRPHSTATASYRDVHLALVERRYSLREDRFQDIPQTGGAADDVSLADEIMTEDEDPLYLTPHDLTSGLLLGLLSGLLVDQPDHAAAGQSPSSAARVVSRSSRPTAVAQTDGPADDDSPTDEPMPKACSSVSENDEVPLSTNTAAESLSPENTTGIAPGGRTFPVNLSLPIRSRPAPVPYTNPSSSSPNPPNNSPEEPSPKTKPIPSASSDSPLEGMVSEDRGIRLAKWIENVEPGDGSASPTSNSGCCGCCIFRALFIITRRWFRRRNRQRRNRQCPNSQPQEAAPAVTDTPDGPPALQVMPEASRNALDLPDGHHIVLDTHDESSTPPNQAQASEVGRADDPKGKAPAARNEPGIPSTSAPASGSQDCSSPHQDSSRGGNPWTSGILNLNLGSDIGPRGRKRRRDSPA